MRDAPILPKTPALAGWNPKWNSAAMSGAVLGGMLLPALIGAGGYLASFFRKGKRMTMSKIERTALAFLGALIEKVQELEKENVQLARRAVDAEMARDAEKSRTDKAQQQLTEATDQLSKAKIQIEELEQKMLDMENERRLMKKARKARRQ